MSIILMSELSHVTESGFLGYNVNNHPGFYNKLLKFYYSFFKMCLKLNLRNTNKEDYDKNIRQKTVHIYSNKESNKT